MVARLRVLSTAGEIADWVERRAWIPLLVFVFCYVPAAFLASRDKPLWHDELFTWYIAQAPTLSSLWSQSRNLDLNPPLVYWLTRLSMHLFGTGALATRMPEICGFLLFLLGTFRFVRQRMGVLYGFFAAALLLAGKSLPLAVEARPYGLLLGFLTLALCAWQAARNAGSKRPYALAALSAAVACMLLSHIFSVLAVAALLFAEVWTAGKTRKPDWGVLASLLLPLPIVASWMPMLRAHGGGIYPPAFQPDANTIFEVYIAAIDRELIILCLTALVVLLLGGRAHLKAGEPESGPAWFFTDAEWVAMIGILAFPLVLLGWIILTHGPFFSRYGAVANLGVVLLAAALLGRWTIFHGRLWRPAAAVGAVLALLISGLPFSALPEWLSARPYTLFRSYEPATQLCEVCALNAEAKPLPMVTASGLIFLEMNHREPGSTLDRVFYLTDRQASTTIAHANIFERMAEVKEAFHLRGQVAPYRTFVATHPSFYVLGEYNYPEDWLLKKLMLDHARLQLVRETTPAAYRQTELYLVTMPEPIGASPEIRQQDQTANSPLRR